MINIIKYIALLLILFMAQVCLAQQVETDDAATPLDQVVPVADDDADYVDQEISTNDQDKIDGEERLLSEFARYRRLLNEGSLDEADIAAKRIVEMAISVYGPQSRETASALNNLGIVQHGNEQYDAAIQNFTSSIEILEIIEDRLNGSLINPLKGLGAAQLGNGRPDQALKTFTRAAHITHVNEGPHNLDQVEILESLAETQIRMGEVKEARKILDRIHGLNVRYFEEDPMGLLPSLLNRASWQHRAGYFSDERVSYRRAIRIVEASSGKYDPLLIEPLRRLGESFYYIDRSVVTTQQQSLVSGGELYFKRAVRIADRTEDLDWREMAKTKLALADYFMYIDAHSRARKIYRDVWERLSTGEEQLAARSALLEQVVPLRTNDLPSFAGTYPADSAEKAEMHVGKIMVDYSVSDRGRVRKLRTEALPPEFTDMQRIVHREIRRRIYRPKMVEAVPVDVDGIVFEHNFSYMQADLDALLAKKAATTEDKGKKDSRD